MPCSGGIYYFLHEGGTPTRPPVVLIHGAGGSHMSWLPEIRRMAGYHTYSVDLPGHGKSEGVGRQYVSDYAGAILQFIDKASLWKAVFVGHSLGGAIALTMGLEYPERCAGLGLIGCGARMPVARSLLENTTNPATHPLALQTLLNGLFSPQVDARVRLATSRLLAGTRPAVIHGDLQACDHFDATGMLNRIDCPTLVLCGTEDRLTPLRYSQELANSIRGAALQTVDGAGHAVMLEQPKRVARLLGLFLMTVPYTPGG